MYRKENSPYQNLTGFHMHVIDKGQLYDNKMNMDKHHYYPYSRKEISYYCFHTLNYHYKLSYHSHTMNSHNHTLNYYQSSQEFLDHTTNYHTLNYHTLNYHILNCHTSVAVGYYKDSYSSWHYSSSLNGVVVVVDIRSSYKDSFQKFLHLSSYHAFVVVALMLLVLVHLPSSSSIVVVDIVAVVVVLVVAVVVVAAVGIIILLLDLYHHYHYYHHSSSYFPSLVHYIQPLSFQH
ncbi:uncharacterized protein BX664DRAFT_334589 [Halteromyces radiatus]|uniref:uncharacterized protein n=1 Tax=Halteromyces radiatus TaxID=101107 RepID=UPI00221F33AB|nr:uncharacterized protein BX664DRAFT_334589 [Halteromyces radiatus]KAI8090056.1 hypothetical protein BX664DRAFT_334589 [Halteromyces radiatus]